MFFFHNFYHSTQTIMLPGRRRKRPKLFKYFSAVFYPRLKICYLEFTPSSKVLYFFIFWGCSSGCNADFLRVSRLSTPKKGLKNTMVQNFIMLKCPPNLYTIWDRPHMLSTFFAPKAFFDPTTQNNILWSFLDPQYSNFFWFKKTNV